MPDTFSSATNLRKPADNAQDWDTLLNANFDLLDSILSPLVVATTEVPSTTLNVKVSAGSFRKSDGTIVDYAGTASQALTLSATNYLYLADAGTLTVSTTGWPATTFHVRLAIATADATTVTAITYPRVLTTASGKNGNTVYLSLLGGTFDDSAGVITVGTGTTNGVKLGAGSTNKLGFFGATPVVQPANTVELVALLVSLGLRATGGNPALNLGTGAITCGAFNPGGLTTIADAQNIAVGSTTGTKVGTAVTQKLSFWNATPIVQPASANQAAIGTLTTVTLTDSTTGTPSTTLVDVTGSFVQATLNNNFASLAAQINNAVADHATLKTLLNQIRSDLVAAGLLKGSA
jgi:hypothetical protein